MNVSKPNSQVNPSQISRNDKTVRGKTDSKVHEVFKNNKDAILLFAIATFPIFFIAWPLAALVGLVYEEALLAEEKGEIADKRMNFINLLYIELTKKENKNKPLETIFEEFQKECRLNFKEVFPENTKETHVIQLALIFGNNKRALQKHNNEAILQWKKLIKVAERIKNNPLYQKMGDVEEFSKFSPKENRDLEISLRIDSLSGEEVKKKLTQEHRIPLDMLQKFIEPLMSSSKETGHREREERLELYREILETLEVCKTTAGLQQELKLRQSTDPKPGILKALGECKEKGNLKTLAWRTKIHREEPTSSPSEHRGSIYQRINVLVRELNESYGKIHNFQLKIAEIFKECKTAKDIEQRLDDFCANEFTAFCDGLTDYKIEILKMLLYRK